MAKLPTLQDIEFLKSILDAGKRSRILTLPADCAPYTKDWTGRYSCPTPAVLFPETTAQVSRILSFCSQQRLCVVPQGGLTGLVGGAVPSHPSHLVLNLSLLDGIFEIDGAEGRGSFGAGVILERADNALRAAHLMAPVDLGAKGSCQMGGMVACNAGGTRFRRYGSMHANTAGLEVVLADGLTLQLNGSAVRKNNTGVDLKHLFIGSEGTLGVITKVDLYCPRLPVHTMTAILAVDHFEAIPEIYKRAEDHLGSSHLAAFEFWDGCCERLVLKHVPQMSIRKASPPFSVLVEGHGNSQAALEASFSAFLEALSTETLLQDAVMASDGSQERAMWGLRETIPEACQREGSTVLKYDISLPVHRMYDIVHLVNNKYSSRSLAGLKAVGFGHVGDHNLHLNVIVKEPTGDVDTLREQVDRTVYDYVHASKGSISAEHGIGQLKMGELLRSMDPARLFVSQLIKQQLDPYGIMNPGKLFPPSSLFSNRNPHPSPHKNE